MLAKHATVQISKIIFLGILSLNQSNIAYALSMDDLVKRDNLYFEKFTNTPFTGQVDEGLFRGKISKGLREGEWFSYYKDGQLRNRSNWLDGRKDGKWISYHENGQRREKGSYKTGLKFGWWRGYHQNGEIAYKGEYLDLEGFKCRNSLNCEGGYKIGIWVEYYDNGQISYKGEYRDGKQNGTWISYQKNGQVYSRGDFVDGVREGLWEYFIDGKPFPFMSGYYKNGKKVSD